MVIQGGAGNIGRTLMFKIKYKHILRSVCDIDLINIYYLSKSTTAKTINMTMSIEYDKRTAITTALLAGRTSKEIFRVPQAT